MNEDEKLGWLGRLGRLRRSGWLGRIGVRRISVRDRAIRVSEDYYIIRTHTLRTNWRGI